MFMGKAHLLDVFSLGDYEDKILSYAIVSSDQKIIFEGYNLEVNETKHYTDKKHENKYRFPTQMTLRSKGVDGQSQLPLN